MSLNGKKVTDFSLQAYQKGAFKEITSHALEGSGAFSSSTLPILHLCALRN